ncbi:ATP-binding protein [Streptomyces sp. NA04227]|uniref:ATP-binding protein n=1 Tax=Streptomyces sp. NA04227 TaxID=2742136 RepID=UPI00159241DE|nr:ATP-binding protein [Streptomyces sp. NA04227]QKW06870.1 ATP-binding protein [Streptomyces sp. NA04227]
MPSPHHSQVPELPPPASLVLPGTPQFARIAREFARVYVARHAPFAHEDYLDTVVLITSELVTNAIRYGTEPGDSFRLRLDTDLVRTRIEVHDPVRRRPRARPTSDTRERGRGLAILDALCPGLWGIYDIPFGKAVWAQVKAR